MVAGRSGRSDSAAGSAKGPGRGRGSVTMIRPLPRFVYCKPLASGATGFYWHVTKHYRGQGCAIPDEPLGTDYVTACGEDGNGGRAAALNALFDEWRKKRVGETIEGI